MWNTSNYSCNYIFIYSKLKNRNQNFIVYWLSYSLYSTKCPDQILAPASLLFNGYQVLMPHTWSCLHTTLLMPYALMECAGTILPYLIHKFYFLCSRIIALLYRVTLNWLIPDTMQRRWYKKRVVCVCLLSVLLYLIVKTRMHDVAFEVVIPNSKPEYIWDFVADFSNLKKLYPNM